MQTKQLTNAAYDPTQDPLFIPLCINCGDEVNERRWELGYKTCLWCGEEHAKQERKTWCVVQEYGKGGYQFVTATAAPKTLKETNQKQPR